MIGTVYIEWIKRHFPDAELVPLSSMITESISVDTVLPIYANTDCQILKIDKMTSLVVDESKSVFFDRMTNFRCANTCAILHHHDVVYDRNDPSISIVFTTNSKWTTYSDGGTMILRANGKEEAYFLAWYISLEEVALEIQNKHSSAELGIEALLVPSAPYLRSGNFIKTLENIANTESIISGNAKKMLLHTRQIREDIIYDFLK